jgi:acetyl-CoA carboxylase biotin carboxyl carrier protein
MDAVSKVRELIEIMASNDLTEIEVEQPELRIKIRKSDPPAQYVAPMAYPQMQQADQPAALQAGQQAAEPAEPERDENLVEITSPMVGTFYRSSSPGAESYVGIGDEVESESVVCIIEAMKVMNEIKAEVEGRIAEILVQDAEPVEFGQVLFLVEPLA